MLVAPDHGDVLAGKAHDGRKLPQAVVDRARVANRLAIEHVLATNGRRVGH